MKTVLITGTTSGVGQSLLRHYYELGWKVIAVNRRADENLVKQFPLTEFFVADISSYDDVHSLLRRLTNERQPNLFILNAGINKADNFEGKFDLKTFQEVFNTNLLGVMTFVAAATDLKIKGATFLGISSTSNIVPNPGHIGYYLSKWGIKKSFEFLQKNNPENIFKTVVLGPIHTNIMRHFDGPIGFQRKLYNFLAGTSDPLAVAIARFSESRRSVLHYPLGVCIFYWFVKWGLKIAPFAYGGTRHASHRLAESSNSQKA